MTLEVLDWAQHYLRSNLMRFGPVEFELCPFDGPVVIYRGAARPESVAEHRRGSAILVRRCVGQQWEVFASRAVPPADGTRAQAAEVAPVKSIRRQARGRTM
jgi:hypothetical protein